MEFAKTGIMTQRYAHHWQESLRDGIRALEKQTAIGINLTQHAPMVEGQACILLN